MHHLNRMRLQAGLVIKPELEITTKTPAVEPVVETKVEEVLVWEAVNLQFGVDGNGPFNVMSNKGEIHDTYETKEEAKAVADTLNKKHGGGELKEAKKADKDYDKDGEVESSEEEHKGAVKKAIEKKEEKVTEAKKADKDYDKDGEVESSEEEHKGVVDKKIKAKKSEDEEVTEANGTVLSIITDKDENPKPNKDEQSIAKGEEKVKCPANLLKQLKTEIGEAEKEAAYYEDRDQKTSDWYGTLATAMTNLHDLLSQGTHESMQRAQIEFSSWMSIMQHKVPSEVTDFIMKGGQSRGLKDIYKEVKVKSAAGVDPTKGSYLK